MKNPLALALIVLLGGAAHASGVTTGSKLHLLDSSEGQVDPIQHGKADLFLLGLGLTAGGLVLGGAGFAVLYACSEPQATCAQPTMTYVGWALAAPGVLPLAAGLIILYLFTGGRRGVADATDAFDLKPKWALAIVPVSGGGMVGAAGTF